MAAICAKAASPEKFIELAGGKDAKFVIVPTAGGNKNADGTLKVYDEETVLRSWKARGLTNVRMLHTADPKVADTPEFVKPLLDANAVWFEGGRQWNIVDSYANTLDLQGVPSRARARRRDRRVVGGRLDSG